MSFVYYLCCTYQEKVSSFEEGYLYFQKKIREEQVRNLYQYIQHGMTLKQVLDLVG